MNDEIAHNLAAVRQRIRDAALRYERPPDDITLLAVSKTVDAARIRRVYGCGQTQFGENYLQEALAKIATLKDLPIEWHFIGRLQSNKTKPVAESFAWVHGIERIKIAERLSAQRPGDAPPLNVCIQFNVSAESTKGGVSDAELVELASAVTELPRLRLRGLMALPAPAHSFDAQRGAFHQVAAAREMLRARGFLLDTLSMGTSEDLEAAIAEQSTLVRVGSAIFGRRPLK